MFFKVWRQIAAGKTLMRSLMNIALSEYALETGDVLDVGGGNRPSYLTFLQNVEQANIINVDQQYGTDWRKKIDFEKDRLPFDENSVNQILVLNVLEHIYNHRHLVAEMHRVLKKNKTLIGFVPFLINYHADPHDYFRYTHEALRRIFVDAGFSTVSITPVGLGPFSLNFNTLASFVPRYIMVFVWPFSYALDRILLAVKPSMATRFPLGYMFLLTK